jgi:autotransporter-associated beta strand protein
MMASPTDRDSTFSKMAAGSISRVRQREMKTRDFFRLTGRVFLQLQLLFVLQTAFAASATWNLNPTSSDWNTAANWTPATVPDGPSDTATFAISNTSPSIRDFIEVNSIAFNPGASAFTIAVDPDDSTGHSASLTFSGAGVTNSSGITQHFAAAVDGFSSGAIFFTGNASAGSETTFLNEGGSNESGGAETQFLDESNAGSAEFTNEGGEIGGSVEFFDNSSAADGTFICEGADLSGDFGGFIFFHDLATAANATFIANGGMAANAGGAQVNFVSGSPSADNATLIANGGTGGGSGGKIWFSGASNGGTARVEIFGNGSLNIGPHDNPGVAIGSLEGDGLVLLGSNNLTIGSNNLSTTFAGVIQDAGSITKSGSGKLTFSSANTYTGGTTVNAGSLLVTNRRGSSTGSGPVQINAGKLGGTGKISGNVIIGTGSGAGAFLTPGTVSGIPATLTIAKRVTFRADGTFHFGYKSSNTTADKIVARGVTIESGAQFFFDPLDTGMLTIGTVLTAINNTAATPIAGTFANVPDGSVITIGNNTFQADYEGGNGNDLTLTVVP